MPGVASENVQIMEWCLRVAAVFQRRVQGRYERRVLDAVSLIASFQVVVVGHVSLPFPSYSRLDERK
jgi:hypothetical protein